ncbi:MAG TPA: hypothetical protein VG815_13840 [Chloroflexota bacterium]|jgi:hypothetical protein|nr:hypothetical protein [Chloroflexota bacterium]
MPVASGGSARTIAGYGMDGDARAMVAQTEPAFLAIERCNAPKEPTVKILEPGPTKLHSLAALRVLLILFRV